MIGHLRLLALFTVLDIGLNLFFHSILYIVLPKSIVRSFYTLVSGDRCVMEVCNKQLVLFVSVISDID